MSYDYLVVGAGFAGSVCARQLADAGKRVLIIDKRDHIGGNAYDYLDENGIRIHKYGPHLFHTNSDSVWNWLSRFTEWTPYEHRVQARVMVEGREIFVPFPINVDTLEMVGATAGYDQYPDPKNAEEQCISRMGEPLYRTFFEGYTTKMWGRHPRELDASVTARIPIRFNRDDRYFTDKHQALPKHGYTAMFEAMLDHPGIEVRLGESVGPRAANNLCDRILWTGPIDTYFRYCFGNLPYRSLKFDHITVARDDGGLVAPAATVNFPDLATPITRQTEWRWLMEEGGPKGWSVITTETPTDDGEPYYPVPAPETRALYKRYEALAEAEPNVTFLGRLGRYQYLNMDMVVAQALAFTRRLGINAS